MWMGIIYLISLGLSLLIYQVGVNTPIAHDYGNKVSVPQTGQARSDLSTFAPTLLSFLCLNALRSSSSMLTPSHHSVS